MSSEHCYCHLWETNPQSLIKEGLPRGYCGFCEAEIKGKVCGKPGHIRQGNGPYSACWCDEHYGDGKGFNPIAAGCNIVAVSALIALIYLVFNWIT